MPLEVHTFDPDGDLVLELIRHPKTSSILDDISAEDDLALSGDTAEDGEADEAWSSDHANESDGSANLNTHDYGNTDLESALSTARTMVENLEPAHEEYDASFTESDIDVHMVVSSKHMTLASPVFKAMLQPGKFKEGHDLGSAGRLNIPLPDDDPEAFIILLNIIHGRNRRVPRQVDLELMTEIAILVDKYQMVEAAEVFSEAWIEDLRLFIPDVYYDEEDVQIVHQWATISWVFNNSHDFKNMTMLMERGAKEDLNLQVDGRLPIPSIIIETILKKRQVALFDLYAVVDETLRRYQKTGVICSRTDNEKLRRSCDSMVLGSLLKSFMELGWQPLPEPPYAGVCYNTLESMTKDLNVEALCDEIMPFATEMPNQKGHGFQYLMARKHKKLQKRLSGIELGQFKAVKDAREATMPSFPDELNC